LVENRYEFVTGHPIREPGTAIEGDLILIYCRKPDRWHTVRAAETHNYFRTDARMNALAILRRTFKNLQR
jgi:hypothetical protein